MVQDIIKLLKVKEAGAIRSKIKHVSHIGKMNVINFIGLPGTGKSWACLRLAELISEDFHGENQITIKNVVTHLLGLLNFIRSVKTPNQVVVCEEIGVWLSSRRAMAAENVDAGAIFDTLRKKKIIVITNNPISTHLDKRIITLSSMVIETKIINKELGICKIKPMRLQTNPSTGKTYKHRLKTAKGHSVDFSWIGKPSKELTDDYENSKDEYLDALYERLQKKHEDKQHKQIQSFASRGGLPTTVESKRYNLHKKGLTHQEIADMEGVGRRTITTSIERYNQKIQKFQNPKTLDTPKRSGTNLISKSQHK